MKKMTAVRQGLSLALAICFLGLWQGAIAAEEPPPRILVTGEGSVDVAPDMAILNLTVVREAATAREALDANSRAMTEVVQVMVKKGVEERDLQTSNFSINPRYSRPPRQGPGANEAPQIMGYTVRNGLAVKVRDIDKIGEILDASVSLGVNEGGRIQFTNADPSGAVTEARAKAVEDALSRAGTLAKAAGVKLGKVLEISEQGRSPRPVAMARVEMAMDSASGSVPVASGENTYTVNVSVSFAIEQ